MTTPRAPMSGGVLVVDKPAGPTSFDVVQRVRRLLGAAKAGHAGTLDPMATGVLAVCVDDAVKLQRWLAEGDKSYDATVAFGASTDTEDAEGRVLERADASALTAAAIREVLPRLVGDITQVPPMYSAVRVGGRRLHAAARAGETVERAPRPIRVDSLELVELEPAGPGPAALAIARIAVRCGKGTYVRTLAAELGRAVGVPAHLAALRRTAAGPFTLAQAIPLPDAEDLARHDRGLLVARLVPPAEALGFMPALQLSASQVSDVAHGRPLTVEAPAAPLVRAIGPDGRLVALCEPSPGGVRPVRVFAGGASR